MGRATGQDANIEERTPAQARSAHRRDGLAEAVAENERPLFDIALKTLLKAWRRICDAAGIEDLRIHDLRHEGISRAAESGLFPTILDLQAFSGHRDLRSLSRYTHLCMTALAIRADQAEAARLEKMEHNGRMRLKQSALSSLVARQPRCARAHASWTKLTAWLPTPSLFRTTWSCSEPSSVRYSRNPALHNLGAL